MDIVKDEKPEIYYKVKECQDNNNVGNCDDCKYLKTKCPNNIYYCE